MFDLRSKEDIVRDIATLNTICNEWDYYHRMLSACIHQCNIKKIKECDCMKVKGDGAFSARLHCEICGGTGYKITFNKDKSRK